MIFFDMFANNLFFNQLKMYDLLCQTLNFMQPLSIDRDSTVQILTNFQRFRA